MKVGISNYVGGAALAVIGGAAALYTYISQTFDPSGLFDVLMLVALLCLVASIFLGGRGADATTVAVANETWTTRSAGNDFNLQALLTLLGLLLVLGATVLGAMSDRRESNVETQVKTLEKQVDHLQIEQDAQLSTLAHLRDALRNRRTP
jgi:preprotein translocase subunit SecG